MSRSPFEIDGPACISFSGGRTSGYMLWRILQAHGGTLPPDVVVVFANTGKEMPQTLDFVRDCGERWVVPITWVEFNDAEAPSDRWRTVTYETASRNGEPFAACIKRKNYLPNPVTRFCTQELKIRVIASYLKSLGWSEWTTAIGIRADEPRRVARISAPNRDRDERIAPLAAVGITATDVGAFWASQPFDLQLPNVNGKTAHGNCDLCFLKGAKQIMSLIAEKPERAVWWAKQEAAVQSSGKYQGDGDRFRKDRPSYADMMRFSVVQQSLLDEEPLIDCFCTD
jgi:3'-phosphoadenosine 5'-phosphosulfate sulfotransferase (PAPS reductase)/FAD synthetase